MKATVAITVEHKVPAKSFSAAWRNADKEFNNRNSSNRTCLQIQRKYCVVFKEKYDITGDKLLTMTKWVKGIYADTNANPCGRCINNEAENLNKTVERGS